MTTKTPTTVWLLRTRITDDPEGDLISDMQERMANGVAFPFIFASIKAMRSYLRDQGACHEAMAAVPGVWRRYRQWLDSSGGGDRKSNRRGIKNPTEGGEMDVT